MVEKKTSKSTATKKTTTAVAKKTTTKTKAALVMYIKRYMQQVALSR